MSLMLSLKVHQRHTEITIDSHSISAAAVEVQESGTRLGYWSYEDEVITTYDRYNDPC